MSTYSWAAGYIDSDRPKIVTSRFQYEDGYTIDRYHATGGYQALRAALARTPGEVHDEVKNATVLGRGGAGFPAGTKWGLMPANKYPRYLVVNGDESEPGTYKDRLLMERDPHQLVEGCLIAAYAAGLSQVFLYIRGEMPLAHERVGQALNEAYAAGYVGKNILGTSFSVDIVLHWGAGAYVVGEETALIESLEGKRGEPRYRPLSEMKPAEKAMMQAVLSQTIQSMGTDVARLNLNSTFQIPWNSTMAVMPSVNECCSLCFTGLITSAGSGLVTLRP